MSDHCPGAYGHAIPDGAVLQNLRAGSDQHTAANRYAAGDVGSWIDDAAFPNHRLVT